MLTTELFLTSCYQSSLSRVDLDDMTIGMCLDYIDEYIEMQKPQKETARPAGQNDFDSF